MNLEFILHRIAFVVSSAEGKDNAVSSKKISKRLGQKAPSSREIRRIIASNIDWFWDRNICLLAAPGYGFFIGTDIEEFEAYNKCLAGLELTVKAKRSSLDRLCIRKGLYLNKHAS